MKTYRTCGVDTSGSQARTVVCTARGSRITVEPTPTGTNREGPIANAIRTGSLLCAAALPADRGLSIHLSVPMQSISKARRVFPSLLDVELPFPLENCTYCFAETTRTPEGTVKTLALVAPKTSVNEAIDSCSEAGFEPHLVLHEGYALWDRSVRETDPQGDFIVTACVTPGRICLALGTRESFISSYVVRFNQTSSSAGLTQTPSEIRRALLPDCPRGSRLSWHWAGEHSSYPKLMEFVENTLVESWSCTTSVVREPEHFLARSLADQALRRPHPEINLRNNDLLHPAIRQILTRKRLLTSTLFLVAGLLLLILSLAWTGYLDKQAGLAQAAIVESAEAVAPGVRLQYGQEILQARRALQETKAIADPLQRMSQNSVSDFMDTILAEGKHYGITLGSVTLTLNTLTVTGSAGDWDNCRKFVEKLSGHGIPLHLNRHESLADERVYFTIKGRASNEQQ